MLQFNVVKFSTKMLQLELLLWVNIFLNVIKRCKIGRHWHNKVSKVTLIMFKNKCCGICIMYKMFSKRCSTCNDSLYKVSSWNIPFLIMGGATPHYFRARY